MEWALKIKRIHPRLGDTIPMPRRMSELAAGFDLAAAIEEPVTLAPRQRELIPCGFAMALPPGYEAQIRPRRGLAVKHGVTQANAPGSIDADYRGEVKVALINHGLEPFTVEPAMRIAQMVIAQVCLPEVEVVEDLPSTDRGEGGFGSTGAAKGAS